MTEGATDFNRLVLHPSFDETINEINKLNIQIPPNPIVEEMDFNSYAYPPTNGELVADVEQFKSYVLDPRKGEELLRSGIPVCAYDESINKFVGLEGTTFLTCHSMVIHSQDDYVPSCYLTLYFYTRSKLFVESSKSIKYSDNPEVDSKREYVADRMDFMVKNAPRNSVIFIDGALIGGQLSSQTVKMNEALLQKDAIPIFFVKNSASNLVTDYTEGLKGKYNSDMHWAYKTLRVGERTNLFPYVDKYNRDNAKLFCYLKAFDLSPQRVEFHVSTFRKYGHETIGDLMNLVYYLQLVQGDLTNPQVRPIAIAEKYARDVLKLTDVNKLMRKLGLVPTMNQERFAWG